MTQVVLLAIFGDIDVDEGVKRAKAFQNELDASLFVLHILDVTPVCNFGSFSSLHSLESKQLDYHKISSEIKRLCDIDDDKIYVEYGNFRRQLQRYVKALNANVVVLCGQEKLPWHSRYRLNHANPKHYELVLV